MAQWKKVIVSGSNISELELLNSGLVSGSGQLAADISGSSNALSASIATEQVTQNGRLDTVESDITSLQSDVSANTSAIAGLDSTYATDAALNAVSSSAATDIAANTAAIAGLDSTYATDAELAAVSTSFESTIENLSSTLSIAGTSGTDSVNLSNDTLSITGGTGVTTAVTDNQVEINIAGGIISGSATGDAQGQIKTNGVNVNINGLGTAATPTFAGLTISGDLDVQGDTTTLNTTNLAVEDKFILLNSGSGSPQEGGLIIDQGSGVGHAYIFQSGSNRFGFTGSLDAEASTGTPDAFAAAVLDEAAGHTDKVEYQKPGNIRVATNGDIFIYS